jgi:two-component sensor histidine kinase
MTLIHRELYSSSSLASIRMREYVENIVNHLLLAYGKPTQAVDVRVRADDVSLGAEEAIPCGLILNELVSNALKYAFPEGGRGELRVAFRREGEQCFAVTVRDNGVGLPAEMDLDHPPSLGLQLVQMLTEQLQGTLEVDRQRGTCFRITFRPREQPPAPS